MSLTETTEIEREADITVSLLMEIRHRAYGFENLNRSHPLTTLHKASLSTKPAYREGTAGGISEK